MLGTRGAGQHTERINTKNLDNGMYLVHFNLGERSVVKRITVAH